MKTKRTTKPGLVDATKLLELARKAPAPHRSKLTPYLSVVFELRNKGYSYEKIGDFLNEHTGLEFTRSQVFAFVQRNSSLFGVTESKIADEEGEPLPVQLLWDHSRALEKALGKGTNFKALFTAAVATKDRNKAPEVFGLVGDTYHAHYRTRLEKDGPVPEWWDGERWDRITADSVRHAYEHVVALRESQTESEKGGPT